MAHTPPKSSTSDKTLNVGNDPIKLIKLGWSMLFSDKSEEDKKEIIETEGEESE